VSRSKGRTLRRFSPKSDNLGVQHGPFRLGTHRLSVSRSYHYDAPISFLLIINTMPNPGVNRILLIITAIGVGLLSLLWNRCPQCEAACSSTSTDDSRSGYLNYDCAGKPHQSSWSAWFHPERVWRKGGPHDNYKDRAGAVTQEWNILYHLGGVGPWVEKNIDVVEGGIAVPDGCEVEQVHMVRYSQLC
jgi:hypothetical protein